MLDRVSGEPVQTVTVGSGEGFVHQFVTRKAGELSRLRDSVLFSVPEVDTLTALGNRQGATLMPILRSAWSGEQLSFAYADDPVGELTGAWGGAGGGRIGGRSSSPRPRPQGACHVDAAQAMAGGAGRDRSNREEGVPPGSAADPHP